MPAPRRHFFVPPAGSAPTALLVLLVSSLGVVSCANWIELRTLAPDAVTAPAVAPGPETQPLPALVIPVKGVGRDQLRDNFAARRGLRIHRALDIMAARGTPVIAAGDGRIARVYRHPFGGLCVYQYDATERYAFYYAHLDAYAKGVKEGVFLKQGDPIGYVGTTGNASPGSPHLHFAMYRLGPERVWHRGVAVNPYPYLREPGAP